jgi:hypothetical protein
MAVPEAAVDEDDGAVFGQDEIGFTGQGTVACGPLTVNR